MIHRSVVRFDEDKNLQLKKNPRLCIIIMRYIVATGESQTVNWVQNLEVHILSIISFNVAWISLRVVRLRVTTLYGHN